MNSNRTTTNSTLQETKTKKSTKPITLGEGAFGAITVCPKDPSKVIKKISDSDFQIDGIQYSTLREIATCKLIQAAFKCHVISKQEMQSIVQFSNIEVDDLGNVLLMMNREQSDLQKYVERLAHNYRHRHDKGKSEQNNTVLTLEQCKDIMYQVAMALRVCHLLNIAHRDLKPENILLSNTNTKNNVNGAELNPETLRITLADFGFARVVPSGFSFHSTSMKYDTTEQEQRVNAKYNQFSDIFSPGNYMCTLGYRPPELLTNTKQYSPLPIDIWSWGVMLWSLLMGTFPAELCDEVERIRMIFQRLFLSEKGEILQIEPSTQKLVNQFMSWSETEFKTRLHGPELDKLPYKIWIDKLTQLYGSEIVNLLESALQYHPQQRMNIEQLLQHSCFANQRAKFGIWTTDRNLSDVKLNIQDQLAKQAPMIINKRNDGPNGSKSQKYVPSNHRKHKMRRAIHTGIQKQATTKQSNDDDEFVKLDGHDVKFAKQLLKEYTSKTHCGWTMCFYEFLKLHHSKMETIGYALDLFKKVFSVLGAWSIGREMHVLNLDVFEEMHPKSIVLMIVMACCRLATKISFSNMHLPNINDYFAEIPYLRSWMNGLNEYTKFDPEWIFEVEIWICKSLQWNLLTPNALTLCRTIAEVCNVTNSETGYSYECSTSDYGGISQSYSNSNSHSHSPVTTVNSMTLPFGGSPLAAENELLLYCLSQYETSQLNPALLALACINICHNPVFAENTPKSILTTNNDTKCTKFANALAHCVELLNISDNELQLATQHVTKLKLQLYTVIKLPALTSLAQFLRNW